MPIVLVLGALGLAGFLVVRAEQPGWWVRLWYPLDYAPVVSGNARLYHLDPALVAAVIYHALNGLRIMVIDFWPKASDWNRQLIYGTTGVFLAGMLPITIIMLKHILKEHF